MQKYLTSRWNSSWSFWLRMNCLRGAGSCWMAESMTSVPRSCKPGLPCFSTLVSTCEQQLLFKSEHLMLRQLATALGSSWAWAAWCNTWLLIKLMPKGTVFSFLFFSFLFFSFLFFSVLFCSVLFLSCLFFLVLSPSCAQAFFAEDDSNTLYTASKLHHGHYYR